MRDKSTRERAARFRLEKQAIIDKLVELSVSSSADVERNTTTQTVSEELRDLVVDIELAERVAKDLDAGIIELESFVRRLERATAAAGRESEATGILQSLDGIERRLKYI